MERQYHNHLRKYLELLLLLLLLVLLMLSVGLVREYGSVRRLEIMRAHPVMNDVDMIQSWMTFDYVNKLFNLPPAYLASVLKISNAHYPRLLIFRYAEANHFNTQNFLAEVKSSVADYLAGNK